MAKLLAVNVGLPQNVRWRGKTVHTGIWKHPVQGRCAARRLNLEGDGQGDLAGHGGEQRAVMVYQIRLLSILGARSSPQRFHLRAVQRELHRGGPAGRRGLHRRPIPHRRALFEVTQPRVTCYRVGIRMNDPRIPALLVAHHRPGFYFRVLEEGEVGAGDEIVKVFEGPERFTVADIDALLYLPVHRPDQLERALRIPALSPGWKGSFEALAAQEASDAPVSGNRGLSRAAGPAPAWRGFRPLRVTRIERESSDVVSLTLESEDGSPLTPALPGQFLVLRLRPGPNMPVLLRNYSMSGAPDAGVYRVSVKREANGKGSTFLHMQVRLGKSLKPVRREEASLYRPAKDLWCCSAPGSARLLGHAPCPGGQPVLARGLVAVRRTKCGRASVCPRGSRSRRRAPARPKPRRLQQTRTERSDRRSLRRARTPEPRSASAPGSAAPSRLLSLWPADIPSQLHPGSQALGRRE